MRSVAGRWIVWTLAMLTSVGGVWLSWDLTVNHAKIPGQAKAKPATQPAESLLSQACTSFAWADCDEASESPWATFPFHSPRPWIRTATLGLAFFTAMICWLVMVGWPSPSRAWVQMLPLMATGFGAGLSIYLDYVMWAKLPKACPLCLGTHVASVLLFILMMLLWPRESEPATSPEQTPEPDRGDTLFYAPAAAAPPVQTRPWPAGWTLAVTPVVMLAVVYAMVIIGEGVAVAKLTRGTGRLPTTQPTYTAEQLKEVQKYYEKVLSRYEPVPEHGLLSWQLAPQMDVPVAGRPVKGPAEARHTVVIFSDFQCPACRKFEREIYEPRIASIVARPENGGVRVIFKHWPICTDCNKHAIVNKHPVACEAAYAAEAAYVLGGDAAFWKMHDLLFERQEDWTQSKDFGKLADAAGLNRQAFLEAMKSEQAHSHVKADIEDGFNLGLDAVKRGDLKPENRDLQSVTSTPSIYIDGKHLHQVQIPSVWRRILVMPPPVRSVGPTVGSSAAAPAQRVGPVVGPRVPAATGPGQ